MGITITGSREELSTYLRSIIESYLGYCRIEWDGIESNIAVKRHNIRIMLHVLSWAGADPSRNEQKKPDS